MWLQERVEVVKQALFVCVRVGGFCVFVAEYGGILEACLHSAHPASVAMVIHLSPNLNVYLQTL